MSENILLGYIYLNPKKLDLEITDSSLVFDHKEECYTSQSYCAAQTTSPLHASLLGHAKVPTGI